MRRLLLAIALVLMPGAAVAQGAPPSAGVQRMAAWGQQLTAIQQPIVDAYQHCGPVLREIATLLDEKAVRGPAAADAMRALLPAWHNCLAEMRGAVASARAAYQKMAPMPPEFEHMFGFNSADVLRRSADALGGVSAYSDAAEQAVDAIVAGDRDTAMAQFALMRARGGALLDGNILLLETIRKGMPLDAHKGMMDLRILIARTQREIILTDPAVDTGALSAKLRAYGAQARGVAVRMRADWRRESAGTRAAIARLNDPRRSAWMANFDTAFGEIANVSQDLADLLEPLPQGPLPPGRIVVIADQAARYELRVLQAVRTLTLSIN